MSTNVVLQWGCREITCVLFDSANGAGESHTRRHIESQSQHGFTLHRHHTLSLFPSMTCRPSFTFIFIVFLPPTPLKPSLFTLPSFWWVCSISKPLVSFHTAPVKTGTDHRGFIFAPGRSGFILPSPAQRKTALLSPVLGCQPLIIEFPIDPLPSAIL